MAKREDKRMEHKLRRLSGKMGREGRKTKAIDESVEHDARRNQQFCDGNHRMCELIEPMQACDQDGTAALTMVGDMAAPMQTAFESSTASPYFTKCFTPQTPDSSSLLSELSIEDQIQRMLNSSDSEPLSSIVAETEELETASFSSVSNPLASPKQYNIRHWHAPQTPHFNDSLPSQKEQRKRQEFNDRMQLDRNEKANQLKKRVCALREVGFEMVRVSGRLHIRLLGQSKRRYSNYSCTNEESTLPNRPSRHSRAEEQLREANEAAQKDDVRVKLSRIKPASRAPIAPMFEATPTTPATQATPMLDAAVKALGAKSDSALATALANPAAWIQDFTYGYPSGQVLVDHFTDQIASVSLDCALEDGGQSNVYEYDSLIPLSSIQDGNSTDDIRFDLSPFLASDLDFGSVNWDDFDIQEAL
jgi:hypothetical protein